ncbi:class-II aminoacyl-tRNA synthetase family protein [Streptomyces paludis]|uniref:Aminoacyl-transfer RNA synthetases class-II family profile domain-containing protein n=1 Tax=Streptomyces paludis TaxID=2282738 RepID=A0A345HT38_9ACTN|nr:hypothetical protein [Streptomyces paludis]AXG79862.1 hypothetical protein DVK44_21880 [Streptomyces paludis]
MSPSATAADQDQDRDRGRDRDRLAELDRIGLRWSERGSAALTGPLLELADRLDRALLHLAARWDAVPEEHPALLAAEDLEPVAYLSSFPQLATFAVSLSTEGDDLESFAGTAQKDTAAALSRGRLTTPRDVLTPAACYHVYAHHRGRELTAPLRVTTRNTCFRREDHFTPLRRQWSFRMREIVCLGTPEEVTPFLDGARTAVDGLLAALDLTVRWAPATDPFFNPAANPQYLMQKLHPTKYEACYGDLAIASVNLHQDHFGGAYAITRDGRPVTSGCVAFGIERWLYAVLDRWGTDPAAWPDPLAAVDGDTLR